MKKCVTAAALVALCSCGRGPVEQTDIPTAKAVRGPLAVTVTASGEVRAADTSTITPQLRSAGTVEFLVEEGTRVTNNQVVARFNTDETENALKDLDARLNEQKTALDAKETQLEIQKLDNTKNLKKGEQDVRSARLEVEKLQKGDAPLERRNAELKVQTTDREWGIKKRQVVEIKLLLEDGFVTADQVEEEEIALDKARVAAGTAAVELEILNAYTLPLRETKARDTLAAAETEFEKTQKSSAALLAQKIQEVESARIALALTKKKIEERQAELEACVVRAPTEGVVTYGDPRRSWRRTEIYVGAKVHPGQTLMTIPDMSAMQVVVNVPEADIQKVAVGQAVDVLVEAAGSAGMRGTVERVGEVANTGGFWGSDVKEFEVEIDLADGKHLKPGFSCRTKILVNAIDDALQVPLQAVFRDGKRLFVYGTDRVARDVVTGDASESMVQVLNGLAEGDTVLLVAPGQ